MITIIPSQNCGQEDSKKADSAVHDKCQKGSSTIIDANEAKELLLKYFDPNSERYIFKER